MLTRSFVEKLFFLIGFLLIFGLGNTAHAALKITQLPAGSVITPNATQFSSYNCTTTWTASGGAPGVYTWSATGLPAGVSLKITTVTRTNDTCTLTGIPSVSGAYNTITISVTDSGNTKIDANNSLSIAPACQLSGSIQGLYFGVLNAGNGDVNPSTSPPITSTVTTPVTFQCGTGLTYAISVNNPLPPLQMTGQNSINFTVGLTAGGTGLDAMPLTPLIGNASTIDNFSNNFYAGTSSIGPVTIRLCWPSGTCANHLDSTLNVLPVNIVKICTTAGNGAMSITINPSTVGAGGYVFSANGSVTQPQVNCTHSAAAIFTITASNAEGSNATGSLPGLLKSAGHPNIAYTLTFNPSVVGNGFSGAVVGIGIDGTITQAVAQAAEYSATGYAETVTLTFNY